MIALMYRVNRSTDGRTTFTLAVDWEMIENGDMTNKPTSNVWKGNWYVSFHFLMLFWYNSGSKLTGELCLHFCSIYNSE